MRWKGADIRSDLYSLGVTVWVMLTGKVPFDGPTLEVIEKHLHDALPTERLEEVPKPVVSLIESLLEKDPAKRPQTPFQLQTMIQAIAKGWERINTLGRFVEGTQIDQTTFLVKKRKSLYRDPSLLGSRSYVFISRISRAHRAIDAKSVAVLPFDNVGDDKQKEYFGDGLTTEVIFQLSKISDLRVISRSSVLRYRAGPERRSKKRCVQIGARTGELPPSLKAPSNR